MISYPTHTPSYVLVRASHFAFALTTNAVAQAQTLEAELMEVKAACRELAYNLGKARRA